MKKDALFSKRVKAIAASAMAVTLAVPSAMAINGTTPVSADVELPEAIAVYNFDDAAAEKITVVDNAVKPTLGEDTGDSKRTGNVFTLADSIVTDAVVKVTTSASVDSTGKPIVITSTTVLKEAEYCYSEAKIENPYKGMTELIEEPEFPGYPDEDDNPNPYWETGVTISYWQKATDTDSSVISFSNEREHAVQKDDKTKYNLFNLYKANPDNPLFSIGTPVEITFTKSGMKIKDAFGADVDWADPNKQIKAGSGAIVGEKYTVLVGCGPFVKFNPNYQAGSFYLKPSLTVRRGETLIKEYTLESIDMTTDKKDGPIDAAVYGDPTAENTQVRSGTAQGGLQLNSSGAWAYDECGSIEIYKGSVLFEKGSLDDGNKALAHAFVTVKDENGKDKKVYQDASLVSEANANQWHYITRVIKNDSISTYVDGVLKDKEIYADWSAVGSVIAGKGFNVGWGYHSSAETDDPIIVKSTSSTPIFNNDSSITIAPSGSYAMKDYSDTRTLGYNSNTVGMTIMEMLVDEGTTLSFGGQSTGVSYVTGYVTETQAGTAIDNVAFFAEPLTNAQVAALYEKAKEADIEAPDTNPTPSPEPSESATPEPSESAAPLPSESAVPLPSESEPAPTESVVPTPSESATPAPTYTLGDVDDNGKIELADAQLALKAALKITTLDENAKKAADVDNNGKVELADAQKILKVALKIDSGF